MPPIEDSELAGLSAEEREALAGDDEEKANLKAVLDEAGEDDDEKDGAAAGADDKGAAAASAGDDKGSAAGDDKAGADAAAAAAGGDGDGKGAAAAAAGADDADEPFVPRYVAPAVEKYDEQVAELDTKRQGVLDTFRNGDIDAEEMVKQLGEIDSKKGELLTQKIKADISAEAAEQTAAQQWQWEVNRFMRTTLRTDGVDYKGDPILNAALDTAVKALANDEKNSDKESGWFLEEAHRQIKARFNIGAKAAPAGGGKGEGGAPKPAADVRRRPDLSVVGKTLAVVPAGEGADDSKGDQEFAHLDGLEGMELETAVARMSKDQQERWLRSA